MRYLALLLFVYLAPRGAWAAGSGSERKLAWDSDKIPQCDYASTFWSHESFMDVTPPAWDALTAQEQNKAADDFCRHYRFYLDADRKFFDARCDMAEQKDAAGKLAVINRTETNTELATEMQNIKTYFGEDSTQARYLGFYTKDFAEKKAALQSEMSAQKSALRGQDIQQKNSSLAQAAGENDAAGLNHVYDNSNAAPVSAGPTRSLASVGTGAQTSGALAAKPPRLSADDGPAPAKPETDSMKTYEHNENAAWFGMKGKADCAWGACPEQRVQIMLQVQDRCASDPIWCQKAKTDCAESYLGSFRNPTCEGFNWMNDMNHQN